MIHPRVKKRNSALLLVFLFCLLSVIHARVTTVPCDRTRKVFTEESGIITDGPLGSNYTQDSHCEWLIKAQNDSQFITLNFRSMGTECSYDYVFVYDGNSYNSRLLGSFSGKTEPQQITATSGHMLILLYSDTNYVLDGFKAEFTIHNCPKNCSNRGICASHTCVCSGDWGGNDCSIELCPNSCSNHGTCQDGRCHCWRGYSGVSCSLDSTDAKGNTWHWLSYSKAGGLTPRAGHSAVYLNFTDSLYVFGGYDLNNVLGLLQIYRFDKSHWEDEHGNIIKDQSANEFDPHLLTEFLKQGDLNRWGVNQGSFFSHVLQSAFVRKYRSPARYGMSEEESDTVFTDTPPTTTFNYNVTTKLNQPAPRYGHAAAQMGTMFVLYGGKLGNGNLSNELWSFDVFKKEWTLRAANSSITPPALTRHTLTAVNDDLYLFGGSTLYGEFSTRMFKIKLNSSDCEQWEEVHARGGKELDVRVVAHTAVYHTYSNSIIVYGGIIANVARFSKLSDKMFAFDIKNKVWSEVHYPRAHLRDSYVPRERAFHSATIVGNYLIVFGGYSHLHNKEEICYDNQMYLYHLGCHSWTSGEVLGINGDSRYPKAQGVFAHAATLRPPSTLLLVGGYHGNVNGDLLAFVIPGWLGGVNKGDPEAACPRHHSHAECLADPECGWCSADEICYGRTVGSNCTTNLQSVRCGGICPALGDCHSCLTLGSSHSGHDLPSISTKLGLHHCTWCVQNARCHHKDDNYGVCGEDTPSQGPGWWGSTGTEVTHVEQCRLMDRRPGLTFIKYFHPPNLSYPDEIAIINATTVDFNALGVAGVVDIDNGVIAHLKGYLHLPPTWENVGEMLRVCAGHARVELFLGDGQLAANLTAESSHCIAASWPPLLPGKLPVDLHAHKSLTNGHFSAHQHSKMELQHNRSHENAKAFTFEYLEPYSNGTCDQYDNCLHCLTDSECGWCELTGKCSSRSENETTFCSLDGEWHFLTLQPSFCANCSNYISCSKCVQNNCEWLVEDAKCGRKGRLSGAAKVEAECPQPCHTRRNCSSCLDERGRCVWCEATQECFSFSVYTSEYQFGLCREWLDRTISNTAGHALDTGIRHIEQCKLCSQLTNCSSCLRSLSCGWCHSRENPIKGACMQGDFGKPHVDCSEILNITADEAEWAYAQCPDVDECGLGLHDCHEKAVCTNTHGSYSCKCQRGFIGDGRTSCTQTCFNNCVHGYCLGAPEFICQCDLGWTGADCALNCGCNNHSTCNTGIGVCDQCQDWTEGEFCDKCKVGSYGNATSSHGCRRCDCNGHGDEDLGICDVQTGICYCKDNTEGPNCEKCSGDFYGDPRQGGRCFYQCEARGMLYDNLEQGLGSHKAHAAIWGGPPAKECLWIISPKNISNGAYIQLTINDSRMNVPCGDNSVYVYDGLPDLGKAQQSQLIGVFCNDASPVTVESRSGHMTVHYKQGVAGQGFEAVYKVLSCDVGCPLPRLCKNNQCVCPDGLTGLGCEREICPRNCSTAFKQGICDQTYGRCICSTGWGGRDCAEKILPFHLVFTELFDSQNLADSLDHLRKNLPRFGHSLVTDKRGSLWMFGGYSLSHGPLNDIRLFDTKNSTWMQVTLEATPEAKMPQGRYFHAAEMVHSKQAIYIHGGLGDQDADGQNRTLGDFWQFSLKEQRWNILLEFENEPPGLAGHTITLQKNQVTESLILIGGFALEHGFNADVWEFDLVRNKWAILKTEGTNPVGIYGHSTVYHTPTQSFYVFGGILFSNNLVSASNKLFVLNMRNKKWNELPTFLELNSGINLPRARYLHSAVTTDDYMIIFGGRTHPHNASDALSAYVYNCNQWIKLAKDVSIIGDIPPPVYAHAMTLDQDSGALYVVGGWAGASRSTVTKITLPSDLCRLWSGGKHSCRHHMGCSFCTVYPQGGSNSTHCHSIGKSEVCNSHNGTLITNNGAACDDVLIGSRSCSNFTTCSSCLANWPAHPGVWNMCQWCLNCGKGMCISANQNCSLNAKCDIYPNTIHDAENCPNKKCEYTDCNHCPKDKCIYTQQVLLSSEGIVKMTSSESIYDWTCVPKDAVVKINPKIKEVLCPLRCSVYKDCKTCLRSEGAEGGAHECYWATQLNLCLAPAYQALYCAGGACGLVLHQKQLEQCPSSCYSFTQCSECLKHAHCGWCARNSTMGDGVCTEGSLDSPADHPLHSTCKTIYEHQKKVELPSNETISWNYMRCPPENECENGHHSCNPESEHCEDLPFGYECVCGTGYRAAGGSCVPVCTQGCVRGSCIRPDVCKCDFGYVGANCSIQCQCNGHSECEGPDKLKICLECHNNTMGSQCEKCKPQFVGDPTDNGQCIPCLTYCYGHSDSCSSDLENVWVTTPESSRHTLSPVDPFMADNPNSNVRCAKCGNNTEGSRCEKCISGYFRGSENLRDPCRKCQCHGHGDMCDPVTGEKCNCGNNTESDATCQTSSSSKNSAQECWRYQCVKCKDSYMGDPKNGHQCYRMISADNRLCFDGKLVDECRSKSSMLNPGQAVFFVIIPKFMNVDIRLTIDVSQGALDVFMSPNDNSFVVNVNSTTGEHHVDLDQMLLRGTPPITESFFSNKSLFETFKSRSAFQKVEYTLFPHKAEGLMSFVTVDRRNTLLWVQGLKNRLVLTFPQAAHDLGYTKFYLVLKAYGGEEGVTRPTQGLLFFRQDQLHIDLFVFFSVFFSCFFLFLAACVVAWKAKQAADVRRARRRHVVEMLHMAKRPFASVTLILGPQTPATQRKRLRIKTNSSNGNGNEVRPIAVEPTVDGLAAVTSILVRLPGGRAAPTRLALASSLVLLGRQMPSSGRAFLRRVHNTPPSS